MDVIIEIKTDRKLPEEAFFLRTSRLRRFAEKGKIVGQREGFYLVEFLHLGKAKRAWFFEDEVVIQPDLPF